MALESANYIDELVSTNPLASDNVSQGDNQLRLIKKVLKQSFPSVDMAVNAIHASDSAPAVAITAGLIWFDTSANLLKIRNEANDAWVTLAVSPVTSNSVDIDAGTVDGAIIGGSSAAAGTFTTLTANTSLTMAEDATIIFEGATDDAYETTLTVVDPTADRTVSLPNATDTLVGLATTDTLTNKTLTTPTITSPVVNTGISGTAVLDSDTMSGASATTVATSESIKAYVDAQVTAQDLDITTDSGSIDIDLDSESLTISGGEGIDTSATGTTVTIAGEEASTSNKGVASFSSDNFSVSSGAVTIKDAGVANAELADMAANTVKVRNANSSGVPSDLALATTEILIGDGTGFTAAALSGDVTMANTGAVTIASGAVENSMLADMAANTVKVRDANSSGAPSDKAVADTQVLIGDGTGFTAAALSSDVTMTNAGVVTIADNAVSLAKMAGLARGKIIYGDASGDPAALAVGSSSQVLTSDGTDIAWATPTVGDITAVNVTSPITGGGSSGDVTIAIQDASTSAKGAASFSSDNFAASSGAITIKDAGVANAELANMAANTVKVRDANSSGVPSDKAVADTQILIGDGTGFTAAALSGDVTMANTGAVTIAANSVDGTMIALGSDAQGDVMYYNGTNYVRLAAGTDGYFLKTQGASANPVWAAGAGGGATDINGLSDALVENNSIWLGNDPSGTTSTASNNIGIGVTALDAITTGDNIVAVGEGSLSANTTGSNNVAIGYNALTTATTAWSNTAVGYNALTANTSAQNNTAVGDGALSVNTTGGSNVAVGQGALDANTTASSNSAVGAGALGANTTGANNTAVGYQSLDANTTGVQNTAVGSSALGTNETGGNNVAVGDGALRLNTTGATNVAVGRQALDANTTADRNVAVGHTVLNANTTGASNAALGMEAMLSNTTGAQNAAFGNGSLRANTTASYNTAYAGSSLYSNTTGANNTALGYYSLFANTTGAQNTAVGSNALDANVDTHGNTAVGYNALTASTAEQMTAVGLGALAAHTTGTTGVAVGYNALGANTTGNSNTAVGHSALRYSATGANNVAVGYEASKGASGEDNLGANVAVGYQALKDITTGHSNVAIGYQACMDGTTLHNNTAIGTSAMENVTTGNGRNVAVGLSALNACTTGSQLTGVGQNALSSNTTGYMNVAVGSECLDALTTTIETVGVGHGAGSAVTTGGYSVYVGAYAGNLVTTGANNTCIGQRAGDTITDGANNVCIGYQTDVESGAGDSANQIVIGVSLTSPGDNYLVFGKSGNEVSNQFTSNASWSRSSDERIKTNIQDDTLGLSFINALKTKTFKWKPSNEVPQELTRHYHPVNQKDTDIVMHGLIAQEVKSALDAEGVSTFGGWDEMPDGSQSISREMFVIPLIKAVQQLSAEVESLKAQLGA